MAIPKADALNKEKIKKLIPMLKSLGKTDEEIISVVSGICDISHRTASEHFNSWKASLEYQETIANMPCPHQWSSWTSGPAGLERDCKLCFKVEIKDGNM